MLLLLLLLTYDTACGHIRRVQMLKEVILLWGINMRLEAEFSHMTENLAWSKLVVELCTVLSKLHTTEET